MMYEELASYYDALVKDDEATHAWVELIERYIKKGKILELACGSGEITIALANDGYQMYASDLSREMIRVAKQKKGSELVEWNVMDMCNFTVEDTYDGIICNCDSFNYILKDEQVDRLFDDVYTHLEEDGCFIMDMHSTDRLSEFEEEYNEAGEINHQVEVQWTILAQEDRIYQNFAFYHEDGRVTLEQHIQRVYDPVSIQKKLEARGFAVMIYTDFDKAGIQEGEKYFYICRKVKK